MGFKILDYHITKRLVELEESGAFSDLTDNWRFLPPLLGLRSIDKDRFWYKSDEKQSLLTIHDEKKWLFSRLKYGI